MADYDTIKFKEIGQYKWNDNPYTWNNIPWRWNDVPILMEILGGGGLHELHICLFYL